MLPNTTNYLLPEECSVAEYYIKIDVSLKNMLLVKAFSGGIWSSNESRVRPAARATLIARFTDADVRRQHNGCLSIWLPFISLIFTSDKGGYVTAGVYLSITKITQRSKANGFWS